MRHGYFKVLFSVVFVWCAALCATHTVRATEGDWASNPVRLIAQNSTVALPWNANTCYGFFLKVHIRATGDVEACMLGEVGKTHLARYLDAGNQYTYAIALGDETEYTRIEGLCGGLAWCAYSSSTDTLLYEIPSDRYHYGTAILPHFTSYIIRQLTPEPHYQFLYTQQYKPVGLGGDQPLRSGALAISSNGKWAVIELAGYGIVRLDMETGVYRRVVAPSAQYGSGADPAYELAISNDGRSLAVTGQNVGFSVYQIDGSCGDLLTTESSPWYGSGAIACKVVTPGFSPGYRVVQTPRFSGDGMRLTVHIGMSTSELQAVFTPLPASSASTKPLYVVIGDSFASGEGESSDTFYMPGTNTATNKCHVSLRSYAYLVYDKNVTDALNMACSGSRIEEVLGQSEVLEKSDSRSLLQTLSIGVGGNSVNLMDKLKTCVSVSTCEWALPDKRSETANEIQGLYPNIVSFLTTMKQTYGGVNVFFVGYPKVINDDISAQCGVVLSALLNETERRYMNETVHYLNSILAAAAQYVGIPFIDVENVFEGSRLCDPSQAAMNGIRVGDDMPLVSALGELKLIGAESFHPTPAGHALLAARIRDSVSSIDFSAPCTSCGVAQNLSPPEYWQQQPPPVNSVRLMASRFLKETVLLKRTMIEFTFPALSFAPNAVVHLELHSETQQLGTFTADTTGALQGTFDVAADASGYHTIHAFGESASGQAIDRYEIAYIGDTESTSEAVISSGSGSLQVEDVKKSPPIYLDAPSLKATRRPEVLGATTPDAASQTQQVLVRHVQDRALSNWLFMWGIWSGLCFITALLAYSIGRRQV